MLYIQQGKIKTILKKILLVLLGLYVMIATSLYFLQERLLFLPTVLDQDFQYEFNYPFEELFLKTDDHAIINALHFKLDNPKGVILYFHGNAGDLSRWGTITEYFVEKGYDVLVMDYRTYGKSIGKLSEEALYNDAKFCYNFLKEHYVESEITIYGRSLGTGLATYLASKNDPKRLVLETPYYSMVDVAKKRFPMFPVKLLTKYELPTYKFIEQVKCSITMIHGTKDKVIPIASAEKLYDITNKYNSSFIVIEGGGHNNLSDFKEYNSTIESILK